GRIRKIMLKRLLRSCWHVIVWSMAAFATAVVWLWPQMPIWRSPPKVAQGSGTFSPEGEVIVTSFVPWGAIGAHPNPLVYRWDAATSKMLSRTEFPCKEANLLKVVRPSFDGRLALVGEGNPASPSMASFQFGDFYLHDGITGKRLAGPISNVQEVWHDSFSAD